MGFFFNPTKKYQPHCVLDDESKYYYGVYLPPQPSSFSLTCVKDLKPKIAFQMKFTHAEIFMFVLFLFDTDSCSQDV